MRLLHVLAALLASTQVAATAVFAHFMVGNTPNFTVSDWVSNMNLAQEAHIDAFALNMAYDWYYNYPALEMAFQAAQSTGFKLLFSFDYAGNGPWPKGDVQALIQKYGGQSTYFQYKGKPLVSTFEGPNNADDWVGIKQATGCFFVPDWSSVGAGPAIALAGGVADGLFSWAGWAYGKNNMTTYVDASYNQALKAGSKPYMMPVSPWFYTNLPGYNKNWAWRGDNLWYDRWQHVWNVKPEFVQIISWNDYGESHYIGPLDDRQYEAFEIGQAPFNYVKDMPHDAWRAHLPFLIDTYKNLNPAVGKESVVMWYRESPGKVCRDGGTTGNTANQLQVEFEPSEIFEDRIFIAALMAEPANIKLTDGEHINELVRESEWAYIPAGGVGIYQTSIAMKTVLDMGSEVTAEIYRLNNPAAGDFMKATSNHLIGSTCYMGYTNWNPIAVVGYSKEAPRTEKALKLSEQACVEGFGATRFGDFNKLCTFTCKYNYCPLSACVCTKTGKALTEPKSTGVVGHSSNGDSNYEGLCNYACDKGFCPGDYCTDTVQKPYIPPNSPFSNPACVNGEPRSGFEQYDGLCRFSCNLGYCPIAICTCTVTGWLNVSPDPIAITGKSANLDDAGLCDFACSRNYCPQPCSYNIPVNFIDNSCSAQWKEVIKSEMGYAYDMAVAARDNLQKGDYYNHFFSNKLRGQSDFAANIKETFRRMADMLTGTSPDFAILVACDQTTRGCAHKKWYAHMNADTQIMNFCGRFFDDPVLQYTKTVINECPNVNLREAQFTKGAVILHETAHTSYAMRDGPAAIDVAYGYTGCSSLPLGLFDRSCSGYGGAKWKDGALTNVICPNAAGAEGFCDGDMSAMNADTYSHVAAGIYFTQQCNTAIPFPTKSTVKRDFDGTLEIEATPIDVQPVEVKPVGISPASAPPPKSLRHPHDTRLGTWDRPAPALNASAGNNPLVTRADSCPLVNDYVVWDSYGATDGSIMGYAHFGDSYASGMGTGSTSGDKCRVGSNNYGDLIYKYLDDSSIPYQRHSCSGDTTEGLNSQIDAWTGAEHVSVVTLTMGGNDLGFSDLVYYCVITPNTGHLGSVDRKNCEDAEAKAYAYMNDQSANGLTAKLTAAYLRILAKTGRTDTHLYVADYPIFFNQVTTGCEKSSFHYWWGGYNRNGDGPLDRIRYLTKNLRRELNDLVLHLNSVILQATLNANDAQGREQVHHINMLVPFDTHDWCEEGVQEPDDKNTNTWFFLSGWPDVDVSAADIEAAETQNLFNQGSIPLPDANTCEAALGSQPDPYARAMCRVAQSIADAPLGPEAERYAQANADIANRNFSSQSVSWYAPTRQIKTFHPRTPGMYAYRDAVLRKIHQVGQL